jgi:hypothetical protein
VATHRSPGSDSETIRRPGQSLIGMHGGPEGRDGVLVQLMG